MSDAEYLTGEPGVALVERAFRDRAADVADEAASETVTLPLPEDDRPAVAVTFRRYRRDLDNIPVVEREQARYYFGGRHFIEVHTAAGLVSAQHGERRPVNVMTTNAAAAELFPGLPAGEYDRTITELAESALGRSLRNRE